MSTPMNAETKDAIATLRRVVDSARKHHNFTSFDSCLVAVLAWIDSEQARVPERRCDGYAILRPEFDGVTFCRKEGARVASELLDERDALRDRVAKLEVEREQLRDRIAAGRDTNEDLALKEKARAEKAEARVKELEQWEVTGRATHAENANLKAATKLPALVVRTAGDCVFWVANGRGWLLEAGRWVPLDVAPGLAGTLLTAREVEHLVADVGLPS